jgi:hypothetical protein
LLASLKIAMAMRLAVVHVEARPDALALGAAKPARPVLTPQTSVPRARMASSVLPETGAAAGAAAGAAGAGGRRGRRRGGCRSRRTRRLGLGGGEAGQQDGGDGPRQVVPLLRVHVAKSPMAIPGAIPPGVRSFVERCCAMTEEGAIAQWEK